MVVENVFLYERDYLSYVFLFYLIKYQIYTSISIIFLSFKSISIGISKNLSQSFNGFMYYGMNYLFFFD